MSRWPHDPQPFGDAHPASFLGALYSPDMPNTETSHDDYRSVDDLARTHRAGVTWTDPVHVPAVRLRWRAGWASRRFRVVYRDHVGRRDDGHWLPGRRLSRSEPCVGSVGVALMLLRHALVTEMGDAHPRCFGGLLPEWRGAPLQVQGLPTLYGPVDLEWRPGAAPLINGPADCRIEWVDSNGTVHPCS